VSLVALAPISVGGDDVIDDEKAVDGDRSSVDDGWGLKKKELWKWKWYISILQIGKCFLPK
jgi:hypothetical protein